MTDIEIPDEPIDLLQALLDERHELERLRAENERLRDAGEELVELVDDHVYNNLVLDTFTTQPMRRALDAAEKEPTDETNA